MLAVIDTNVWISAFLTPEGYSAEVVRRFRASSFQPVFCPGTVYELRASLSKPRIAARIHMTFRSMNEAVALLYASSPELPDPRSSLSPAIQATTSSSRSQSLPALISSSPATMT